MTNTVITLPFPPSANSLYRNATKRDGKRGGQIITKRHQTWRNAAGWDLEQQQPPEIEGHVALDIAVGRPKNRDGSPNKTKRDIGNLHKAIEDLLVFHRVIEDDSLVQDLRVYWAEGIEGARVSISRREAA